MESDRRESMQMNPPSSFLRAISRPTLHSHILADETREGMGSPSILNILGSMPRSCDATNGSYRDTYREQYPSSYALSNDPGNAKRHQVHHRYNAAIREAQNPRHSPATHRYINGPEDSSHTSLINPHKRKFSTSSVSSDGEQRYHPMQDKVMIPRETLPQYAALNGHAEKRPMIERNDSPVIEKALDLKNQDGDSTSRSTNEDNLDPTSSQSCRVKWCTKPGKRFGLCWAHGGVKKCCHNGCRRVASAGEFCFLHEREISRAVARRNAPTSTESLTAVPSEHSKLVVVQDAQPMIINRA